MPPTRYFRCRALNNARQRLIDSPQGVVTVSDVAVEHGFTHLGRFAHRYEETFGELPSATLAAPESGSV